MQETFFNASELPNIKTVEVIYKGLDNNSHEVHAEVKFTSSHNFTVFFAYEGEFTIDCPQEVIVKFVIDNALYYSKTTLSAIKRVGKDLFFTLLVPKTMSLLQKRKYYRIKLQRSCVIIARDRNDNCTPFMSD